MQRRCTQSSCRRVFSIARTAPVQCPYCSTVYPRVQPDPHALRDTHGYSIRVDFTEYPLVEVVRFFPECRCHYRWFPRGIPIAIGYGLSLIEARALCQRFRREGFSADVITTWNAQKQHISFFQIDPR